MSVPTSVGAVLGYCDHGEAVLSRCRGNNGIGLWCQKCTRWVTLEKGYKNAWLGKDHPDLQHVDLQSLPLVGESLYRMCQGCRQIALCELHHVAPRAYFGDECDRWPMVWICKPCHNRWHSLVTPGLCTSYNAVDHVQHLAITLKPEQLKALVKELVRLYWPRAA